MTKFATNPEKPRTAVQISKYAFIALALLLTVELCSYLALRFVVIPFSPTLVYVPPSIDPALYKSYLEYRHPVLGWATLSPELRYSATEESRPNPSYPDTNDSCVSIYGDSYTFASEVSDVDAWGNVLSGLLGCKVANFGHGGYGEDQAYLRFMLNDRDRSPINILGIYLYDLVRNLNQYEPFLAGSMGSSIGLKPRYVIEDDELRLIPPPDLTYEELVEGTESPASFFPHETFLPGSKHGKPGFSFPYTLAMLRFTMSPTTRNYIMGKPKWMHFYKEDHPSQAVKIAEKIARKFTALADERGHSSTVVVFPTSSSYKYYKRTGILATQALLDGLQRNDIVYLDVHEQFAEYLGERSYCEMLVDVENCAGHYNPEANRVVATVLKQYLDRTRMSPSAQLSKDSQ